MSDDATVDVIEVQDYKHFRITRMLRDGRILSEDQYTAETFPLQRLFGADQVILDPSLPRNGPIYLVTDKSIAALCPGTGDVDVRSRNG
jgi:hypothetical protein